MAESGLVERRMLHGNRRSFYIFLTEHGKMQLKRVTKAFEELEKKAFRGISEEDRETFLNLLSQIYRNSSDV